MSDQKNKNTTVVLDLTINDYGPYYERYVHLVPDSLSIHEALEHGQNQVISVLGDLTEEKSQYKYAIDKWTIREVLGHLMDTERIFNYRSLRFARGDDTPLVGFDHNRYVDTSYANQRKLSSLIEDYKALRRDTIRLYQSFTSDMLMMKGNANDYFLTVRALGFIPVGHELHHLGIIQERYL